MARAHERKQKRIMYGFGGGLRGMIVGTDWLTLLMCACASAFGILLVHSATLQNALSNEKPFSRDTLVMAIAVAAGLLSAVLVSAIDYDWLFKYWFVVAGGCLLLMFLLFTPLAVAPDARSDAKSWLPIPIPGFALNFQPSELLKMGFIITFTKHLDYVKKDINKLRNILLLGLHGMIPVALVVITGDLGSALVFVCLMAGMLFLTGLQLRYFAAVGVLGVVAAPLLWVTLSSFQKNRILAVYYPGYFTDADPTRNQKLQAEFKEIIYQQQQAQYAIGSGQLTGKGLFKGSFIQSGSVPESQNDMIFSVAGEELGFLGAVAVILVIGLIVLRMIRVSSRTRVFRARLLCFGVAVMIGAQSVINIGMCIKLLPVIGITLPFFSAGGSSNLTLYAAIGLAMLVYRRQNEHEDTETYMDYLFAK